MEQPKFTVDVVQNILGVTESFKVPDALMKLMFNREKRESVFRKFLEIDTDVSYDWFHKYFETEQAERKKNKQDFTPDSVSTLLSRLVGESHEYFEPAAGTGGIAIKHWWEDLTQNHNPFFYSPHEDFMQLEEKSERALPFLLFNLSIRGINAIVIHGDSLSREINNVYYILNDKDDFLSFSTINVMPQNNTIKKEFNVLNWIDEPIDYIEADTDYWNENVIKNLEITKRFAEKYELIKE